MSGTLERPSLRCENVEMEAISPRVRGQVASGQFRHDPASGPLIEATRLGADHGIAPLTT